MLRKQDRIEQILGRLLNRAFVRRSSSHPHLRQDLTRDRDGQGRAILTAQFDLGSLSPARFAGSLASRTHPQPKLRIVASNLDLRCRARFGARYEHLLTKLTIYAGVGRLALLQPAVKGAARDPTSLRGNPVVGARADIRDDLPD